MVGQVFAALHPGLARLGHSESVRLTPAGYSVERQGQAKPGEQQSKGSQVSLRLARGRKAG